MECRGQLRVSYLCHQLGRMAAIVINSRDYRAIHPMADQVLVFSVKDQSLLVLAKYSITDGQLTSTVSYL